MTYNIQRLFGGRWWQSGTFMFRRRESAVENQQITEYVLGIPCRIVPS